MATKTLYTITINNWEKHNGKLKKGHTHFLISKRIFDDPAFSSMCVSSCYLFIRLLGACADQCSSNIRATHEQLVSWCGGSGQRPERYLIEMQEFQLLTYEKNSLFINRIEKNRKEKKGIEYNRCKKKEIAQPSVEPIENIGQKIYAHYCEVWKLKYKTNPAYDAKGSKNLKSFCEKNGLDKTKELLTTYLQMNDQWFLTKTHDITTFLSNLNKVTLFLETGNNLSRKNIKIIEQKTETQNLLKMVDEGKI